jgi:hypothetical protein
LYAEAEVEEGEEVGIWLGVSAHSHLTRTERRGRDMMFGCRAHKVG